MILLTHETRILLSVAPADFRRGIDGFVALCQNTLGLQPRDGSVIVFINRARTMIRALSYDVNGYWLMTKRLSRGKFTGWPDGQTAVSPTSARELRIIAQWWRLGSIREYDSRLEGVVTCARGPIGYDYS